MALEKPTKEGMLAGMTARQKGTIGAMIVVVFIVIWQVTGLIGGGGGGTANNPPPALVKPVANQAAKTTLAAGSAGANPVSQATQQAEVRQAQVMNDARFLQLQQMTEQKYISKINDLESLKIQREIAETNQAIATAKLATVTAEKNISDLLTKPATPEIPVGAYANKLATPTLQGESVINEPGTARSAPAAPAIPQVEYTVISVSMQLGKWNAVIGYQGKLYNVTTGDILSADNSVVANISNSGVVLKKDGKTRKVSIMLAI